MSSEQYGGDAPIKKGDRTSYPGVGCHHCPAAFFNHENQIKHIQEQHPNKPFARSMVTDSHRIDYFPNFTNAHPHMYVLSDKQSGKMLSNMALDEKGKVMAVETHPKHRRQGLASTLWRAAQHNTEIGAPAPQHSPTRTRAGEAWAKKVGGEVPPRRSGQLLSARQMQGMLRFD